MRFWRAFYNSVGVPLLYLAFQVARLRSSKIRKGIRARRNLFDNLRKQVAELGSGPRLWVHVSSLGEFEQAKPLISDAKKRWPDLKVVVSFFSPSGYDNAGEIPYVDLMTYLPFDSHRRANRFLRLIQPRVAVFVRHDIWPNHLWEAERLGIPRVLIDASLRPSKGWTARVHRFFNRFLFSLFDVICAVSEADADRIRALVPEKEVLVAGDTRYDQVVRRARETAPVRDLLTHPSLKNLDILVLGSTWPSDEEVVFPAVWALLQREGFRVVVVPHEPTPERLQEIERQFAEHRYMTVRLSAWRRRPRTEWHALIVDSVGLLANLYALGRVAFVGGSFGPGIHSALEPAAHGCAVVFGPVYENSPDARVLAQRRGALVIHDSDEAREVFSRLFDDPEYRHEIGMAALQVVREHTGASQRILEQVLSRFLG